MCRANGASHSSAKCSSTTSISGHTARSGNQGSACGSTSEASASAPETRLPGNGKSTLAHTPSCSARVHAEMRRQPLREPALDALCRHRDHLGLHRVRQWDRHQLGQSRHQVVGAIRAVDVEHPCRVRRCCSPATGRKRRVTRPWVRRQPVRAGAAAQPGRRSDRGPVFGSSSNGRMFCCPTSASSSSSSVDRLQVARGALDRRELGDLGSLAADHAERRELARRDEDTRLERADGPVVGIDARGEALLERLHVSRPDAQALVELRAEVPHLAGVLGQRLLLPREGDGAQRAPPGCSAWPG